MTPIQAIREKCKDCMCGQISEIKLCPITECSLYPFRMGKNPNIGKRELSDEQRAAMSERMKSLHNSKKT
jgi:hypothetical protein